MTSKQETLRKQIQTMESRAMKLEREMQDKRQALAEACAPAKPGDYVQSQAPDGSLIGTVFLLDRVTAPPLGRPEYQLHGFPILKTGKPGKSVLTLAEFGGSRFVKVDPPPAPAKPKRGPKVTGDLKTAAAAKPKVTKKAAAKKAPKKKAVRKAAPKKTATRKPKRAAKKAAK